MLPYPRTSPGFPGRNRYAARSITRTPSAAARDTTPAARTPRGSGNSRCRPAEAGGGREPQGRQCRQQRLPPRPVPPPRRAQVGVVRTAADEPRQRELVEHGRRVGDRVRRRARLRPTPRAPPASRCPATATASCSPSRAGTPGRVQPLEHGDRRPVVPELGVVVVLDHHAVHVACPAHECARAGPAAAWRRWGTGARVRRPPPGPARSSRDTRRPSWSTPMGYGRSPAASIAARSRPQPGSSTPTTVCPARPSARQTRTSPSVTPAVHGHDGVADVGTPRTREIVGHGRPQVGVTVRIGHTELVVGGVARHCPHRLRPPPAREAAQIGQAGAEVVPGGGRGATADRPPPGRRRRGRPRHPGRRADRRDQVSLGDQLAVRLGDDPARAAQLVGERPARRHRAPDREAPVADGDPHGTGQPRVQRSGPDEVEVEHRGVRGPSHRRSVPARSDPRTIMFLRPCCREIASMSSTIAWIRRALAR